tara:strand:- start:5582 stop:5821 length:240 start_codon:yes stop_codon:yes gene_type:complete
MKEKNLPDDINSRSLEDLTKEADAIIDQLEKSKNLENSQEEYQKLIKLNNLIEKKFQTISKKISEKTRQKINNILNKND